jgi:hypothetical protein
MTQPLRRGLDTITYISTTRIVRIGHSVYKPRNLRPDQ